MSRPHPPQEKIPNPRYLPDTARQVADTFQPVDNRISLSRAFRERIAKVKGNRR